MARNRYYHDPARKHIEAFQDFSGGLNTQSTNDNMADNELKQLKNFDLSARGSVQKANGYQLKENANLVPLFDSGDWNLHANVTVNSPTKITLNADSNDQRSTVTFPVESNTTYTLSATHNGTLITRFYDSSGQTVGTIETSTETSLTRTSPSNAVEMRLGLTNSTEQGNGTFTFENIMINEGSTAQPFGYITKGTPQGYYRYYKTDGTFDEVVIAGGRFFINGSDTQVGTGGTAFQTDRVMEAVQYQNKLYIATGNGLVSYDGADLDFVTPYNPEPLEALYVGTNGLMANPDDYIQTTSGHMVLSIKGVRFDKRYGIQNKFITIDMFAEKVNSTDTLEWKVERQRQSDRDDDWFLSQDWATDSSHTFSTEWTGNIKFRISVRKQGNTTEDDVYMVPNYTIKPSEDPDDEYIDSASIDNCNRILVHWDRLIMYGDTAQPDVIYISHKKNPAYFPVNNSLRFNNIRQEGINKMVRFRDNLLSFSDTTIQALYGKDPTGKDPYQRVMVNPSVGCIAPESIQVVANYVTFLSHYGVQYLKSLAYADKQANVESIDLSVQDDIPQDEQALGFVFNSQYHLVLPSVNKMYRFYYQDNVWASSESAHFDYRYAYFIKGQVFLQGSDGRVVKTDSSTYLVEGTNEASVFESKDFDFNESYATKKVKELHIMLDCEVNTTVQIDVFIDGQLDPENQFSKTVTPGQDVYIDNVVGKGYLTSVRITHQEDKFLKVNGLGVVFKLKKP